MPRQMLVLLCLLVLRTSCAVAQSPAAQEASRPDISLEQLILQSRTAEALAYAVKSPQEVPAAAKAILASSDQDVTDQRPDAAAVKLDALSSFLDAYDKGSKGTAVPREGVEGRRLRVQGIQLSNRKEPGKAEPVLRKALELARKAGDGFLEAGVHNNLGYALLSLADEDDKNAASRLEEAAKEFHEARSLAGAQEDPFRAGSYGFNLGQAQLRLQHFDDAAASFKLAAGNFLVAGKESLQARSMLYQGIALAGGNPITQEPLALYDDASRIFDKLGEDSYTGWSLFLKSEFLARAQLYAEAARTAERAELFLVKTGPKDRLAACYFLLSEAHTRLGNAERAEQYRQRLRDLGIAK